MVQEGLPPGVKTGRKHPWAFFVEDQLGASTLYVVGEHAASASLPIYNLQLDLLPVIEHGASA